MNIKDFVEKWQTRCAEVRQQNFKNEIRDTAPFWIDLLGAMGSSEPTNIVNFEKQVDINGDKKRIDAYIPETKVLVEMKSVGIDLMKAELQSDGVKLTPYEQGRRYGGYLPYDEQPRWIIDSNFEEIRVHDMKKPGDPPEIVYLKDLERDFTRLKFIISKEDEHIKKEFEVSVKAGEIVGVLYDKLLAEYKDPTEHDLQSLNRVCVRIVFCLYAEDAGLFGNSTHAFHDYMAQFNGPARFRNGLKELFATLNTPIDKRDPYLDPELMAFPYVNGGLFAEDDLTMPFFTEDIVNIILEQASADFDWSDISPTIFGAIFESTLNPETRRSGGMHYTSIENIHKVIDPLFLDDLKTELEQIKAEPIDRTRNNKLKAFQDKLAGLKFLDPACGSGNFLTESYLCIRRLENEIIELLQNGKMEMAFEEIASPIKVSIGQFYGIEINDFACATAQTAMWIAEAKMLKETEKLIIQNIEFFPLTNNANIVEGNALRMDWNDVIPASQLSYIMGNPPFIGHQYRTEEQAKDVKNIFLGNSKAGKLDYVACWYKKSSSMMTDTNIKAALVSTNSICQGESVAIMWDDLFSENIHIDFAYKTFIWDSEANDKAQVHCVIVGFSKASNRNVKRLYTDNSVAIVNNINGYLVDAPNITVKSRGKTVNPNAPEMHKGSQPTDGLGLILTKEEYDYFCKTYPNSVSLVRQYMGSYEFINNVKRYCLWLKDVSPNIYRNNQFIMDRLGKVADFRKTSATQSVRDYAAIPAEFTQIRQPNCDYLAFPAMSSSRRKYMPIGYLSANIIASNQLYIVPNASLLLFGLMTSNVHMAWMRTVCGRLKSDYRYAPAVYNSFPWPNPTDEQKSLIEKTAQGILDARALYPDSSLADLYDELTMPIELRKAHQANDRAVMQAYGFSIKITEQECVAELMKMYQELTSENSPK